MYTKPEQLMNKERLQGELAPVRFHQNDPTSLSGMEKTGAIQRRQWARASSMPLITPDVMKDAPLWILKGEQPKGPAHPFRSADARRLGETVVERAKRHMQEWRAKNPVQAVDQQVWGLSPEPDEQQAVLAQAQAEARTAVEVFRQDPQWMSTLETALGNQWDPEQAEAMLQRLGSGKGMPPIEVVPDGVLQGKGAYGEGRIWISEDLLAASPQHPHRLTEVLLEELGHHLDSQLNRRDSPGDEGEMFSKLVRDGQITPAQLQRLKQEKDHSLVRYGDLEMMLEHSGWSWVKDKASAATKKVTSTVSKGVSAVKNAGSRSVINAAVSFASDVKGVVSGLKDLAEKGPTRTTFASKPQNPRRRRPSSPPSSNPRGSTPRRPRLPSQPRIAYRPSTPAGSLLRYRPGRSIPSGQSVREVQANLNQLGYSLKVDGKYGPQSKKQVREFQLKYGLEDDGIVGPNTRRAMQTVLSTSSQPNRTVKQDDIPNHYSDRTQRYLKLERNADNMGTTSYSAAQKMREQVGELRDQQVRQSVRQISDLLHTDKQKWYTPWATGDAEVTAAELEEVENILAGVDDKAYKAIISRLTQTQKEKIKTVRSTGEYAEKRQANGALSSAVLGVAREADRKGNNIAETASKITETFQEGLDKGQRSLVNFAQSQADRLDGTFLEDHADLAVDAMDQYSQVSLGVTKAVTSTVSDVVGMAANPDDFIKDMNALGQAIIKNNPLDGLSEEEKEFYKNMGNAIIEPYKALAEEGRYGEIAGLGLGEVLTSLVGGAGVAAKAGKFPKLARLANQVNRLKPSNPLSGASLPDLKNTVGGFADRFRGNRYRNQLSEGNSSTEIKPINNDFPNKKSVNSGKNTADEVVPQPPSAQTHTKLPHGEKSHQLKPGQQTTQAFNPINKPHGQKTKTLEDSVVNTPDSPILSSSLRSKFMREQIKKILADPNHPLAFLVDFDRGVWVSRKENTPELGVQAGHNISKHSIKPGQIESVALEDAFQNQMDNWVGESYGAIFEKPVIEIGGVPIHRRTAQTYEDIGMLPKGTGVNAPTHPGYGAYTK